MTASLDSLVVWDRLEIGPVAVERRRITAPYRIVAAGRDEQTELRYRFEEDVFEPDEPASTNLAAMVLAQVALNYGLFCRQLVFHGPFDRHDRRLLKEMAANTAREIYVKKFLQPNPFLRDESALVDAERRDSYLRAELHFPGEEPSGTTPWSVQSDRVAVLSSGGKESLLSYGLLRELGLEVWPVFVNESGRHWLTAVNAYRHFSANLPRTARVWTSSDRVFSWMLRRLPFVRPDFASVRSDDYPVRLWTVAVFIFGVLPLVRRHGIGRVVIGDEFDTTIRARHRGIPHYDGLFDQSRFFDRALTRYYRTKGWGMTQLSILRPLSELLVEKVLVERYPELQELQTSCHATHTEGDRVRPCGRCEKCRRVVGMLVALGADPERCGYTRQQVESCLTQLATEGVHQEAAGAQHMVHLLLEAGRLPAIAPKPQRPTPHPEVLELRFDPDRSPAEDVPADLRPGLYRILLEHADGAVKRRGRNWSETGPNEEPALSLGRVGSATVNPRGGGGGAIPPGAHDYILGELSWPEAERRLREVDLALLPVGAIEQHGPHLPLDTDAFDAQHLAHRVASSCSEPRPIVLPLIPYGVSYHHEDFAGTVSVGDEALTKLVYDIGMSCARNGITKLIIINGHGGNAPALKFAAQMINRDAQIFTCVDTGETSDVDLAELCETPNDVHAGEIETSTSLATRPELVRMDAAVPFVPDFSSRYLDFTAKRSVEWYARTSRISPMGVLGDPTRASAEKGEQMWQLMVRNLVELVEDIKGMTLDEIYDRRY